MTDAGWRQGARSNCPDDCCPGCHTPGCVFASDFQKFGKHSVRACARCNSVYVDGKLSDKLVIYPSPQAHTA